MILFHWLAALPRRRNWIRKQMTRRRWRLRPSLLGLHWRLKRNGLRPRRMQKGSNRPVHSLDVLEDRIMPGTLLASALIGSSGKLLDHDEQETANRKADSSKRKDATPSVNKSNNDASRNVSGSKSQ